MQVGRLKFKPVAMFWIEQVILMFRKILAEKTNDGPAVITQPGSIVVSTFGIKTNIHQVKIRYAFSLFIFEWQQVPLPQ